MEEKKRERMERGEESFMMKTAHKKWTFPLEAETRVSNLTVLFLLIVT